MKSETRNFGTVLKGNCDPQISTLFLQVRFFLRENVVVSGNYIADNNYISAGQRDPVFRVWPAKNFFNYFVLCKGGIIRKYLLYVPAVKKIQQIIQQYTQAHKLWYLSEHNCLVFYFK